MTFKVPKMHLLPYLVSLWP